MEEKFRLNSDLVRGLEVAFGDYGWTYPEIKRLTEWGCLKDVLDVFHGEKKIISVSDIIDLGAVPHTPKGWSIVPGQTFGFYQFNSEKIDLFTPEDGILGGDLLKQLSSKLVMNANVLDYLLKYPEKIPASFKANNIFFFGTIYRGCPKDERFVRYLFWRDDCWHSDFHNLCTFFCQDDKILLAK